MDTTNMLVPGTMLRNGTYRIERQLSSGGFGNTYLVCNVAFNEMFAMKEFFMRGINVRYGDTVTVTVPDNHATFDSQREKFRKEAIRLRNLHNSHIVRVHDLFEENSTVYYVMDYINGESVSEFLARTGRPMSEEQTWTILSQVLDALGEVHRQQIWHLDIKPGNIMLDSMGNAYLIDFGASKQVYSAGSQTSTALCYTPGYAPVEQVEQALDKFGPWTDFYALGATIYNMQTLQTPPSTTALTEGNAFMFPSTMSPSMMNLISWMMTPQRRQRPQSVADIWNYMQQASTVIQQASRPPMNNVSQQVVKPQPPVVETVRRNSFPLWKILVAVGAVAVVALVVILLAGGGSKSSLAEADKEAYLEKVEECRTAMKKADNFFDLAEAEDMLDDIESLELMHAGAMPEVYNNYDDLMSLYGKMQQKQRKEYIEIAEEAESERDYYTAYTLYNIAHEALPDDRTLQESKERIAPYMGYIYVTEAAFSNSEEYGTDIEEAGEVLHASKMRFLFPKITYNSLLPSSKDSFDLNLTYSIITPDGLLDKNDSSPRGYTSASSFTVEQDEVNMSVWLTGWGNASSSQFKAGSYTFQLYYKGNKIFETDFDLK